MCPFPLITLKSFPSCVWDFNSCPPKFYSAECISESCSLQIFNLAISMVVSVYIRWKKKLDAEGAVQTTWLRPETFSLNRTPSWRMALWKKQPYVRDSSLPRQITFIPSLDVKPSRSFRVTDFCFSIFFSPPTPIFKNIFNGFFCLASESNCWEKVGYGRGERKKIGVKIQITLLNLIFFFID